MFTDLFERILKEPVSLDRGVKTDNSVVLVYPPDRELDFREHLLDTFIPQLDAKGILYRLLDLTGFLLAGMSEEQVEQLAEDEFDDYRWLKQGLSKRAEAALHARLAEEARAIPGGNVIVFATVALYPVVRYGEVLKGLRDLDLPARVILGFPGEERGGKLHFMLQRITWVPRVPETLAKLLVRDLTTEVAPLRAQVEETLGKPIEQAIQEMVRPGGTKSISIAAVRRSSQQLCKDEVITRKKLGNFAVTHGTTKVPFSYGVQLDGESVESGAELDVVFSSPLASGRKQDLEEFRRLNQAAGAKGKTVWWVADAPDKLEARFKRYEALVKVTGDKRFTEDSSADTQDALSEKRKERDELRSALVRDLERAFLTGTVFYGGQEISLEGSSDLKEPLKSALALVIPNVYPRFAIADRPYDFAKHLKALLNPTTADLHKVASDLSLFDTQGSLQRESALVAQLLEVLSDLADEDTDAEGSRLLDGRDAKGFKGFLRAPFGWPDELVRLVLAACFRAGAICIEQQSAAGPDGDRGHDIRFEGLELREV